MVSTPKESLRLRQQPLSSTAFSQNAMREKGIVGIKDFSAHVPNLFIPAYGSHLTTSIYVRGVGARIGTPAVALYVDGVPQVSAAGYDFNFAGVDRVDVLRGPQSTLYGRNSMGGVVRVFTKNPMQYQGTDIDWEAGYVVGSAPAGRSDGGGAGRYRLNLTHYHRISDHFAFSGHLFGTLDDGYFHNEARGGERMDDERNVGARMRFIIKPEETVDMDLTLSHEWLNQGGYPYEYQGVVGSPSTPEPQTQVGHIGYNDVSGYRRNLTNVGLTVEKTLPAVILTSVTGFQHLHDRMDLDQDFTNRSLYTLMQRQNVNTLSEEVILRKREKEKEKKISGVVGDDQVDGKWSWLFGLSALHQWNRTEGPVTFHQDGLDWLNGLINQQANTHLPTITSHDEQGNEAYTMNFLFDNLIAGHSLGFPGTYKTPTTNLAAFHQSELQNLFGINGLAFTAGLRIDYEHFTLDHDARYTFDQCYGLGGRLTYPDGSVRDGMTLVPQRTFVVEDALAGSLSKDYLQLLPKVSLQWKPDLQVSSFNLQLLYASVSRGYRSGGYNVQMFSDLLQNRMQTAIMHNVAEATVPVVNGVTMMPDDAKQKVTELLTTMGTQQPTDVQAATWYKPESSFNYEVGAHVNLWDNRVQADVAAFWMETRNQQVSQMSAGGLGRVTVNSGRSRSQGAEASVRAQLTEQLSVDVSYGYTRARFRNEATAETDGHTFVPFVPRHTFSAGATQRWPLPAYCWLDAISLHADYHGAGRIYWNEANTAHQRFAGQMNVRAGFYHSGLELALYAHNLLSERYQTFYFQTMQRAFAQYTRPMELGVQLRLRF